MRPDFDSHLHDLLDDAAHEIPSNASVLPGLYQRLALQSPSRRGLIRQPHRFIAPIAAVVLVATMACLFIAFHTANPHPSGAATATPIPTTTGTFTPTMVSANGLTVQLDSVDANALRIAVTYHVVNPQLGDSYIADSYVVLVDDQNALHYEVANNITYPHGLSGMPYFTIYFAPLAPAVVSVSHSMTFSLPAIIVTGSDPHAPANYLTGPWAFNLHLTPTISGTKMLAIPHQTVEGVSITPQVVTWVNGADSVNSQGVNIQLAISGLPKVSNPMHNSAGFSMVTKYQLSQTSVSGSTDGPNEGTGSLTLPVGKGVHQLAYFSIVGSQFDPSQHIAPPQDYPLEYFAGSIDAHGSAIVDAGFQGVTVTPGETVVLTISDITLNGMYSTAYPGTWTFTITI